MSSIAFEPPAELPDSAFPAEAHEISSFDGTSIRYDLYPAPSRRVALVVPGFWRNRSHPMMRRFAAFLTTLGLQAAVLDLRGHGESEGVFGFNLHEHEDVAAVAADLLRQGGVDSILLAGFSVGGAIAVSTAARHKLPLAGVLLISPVAEFSLIAPRLNLLTAHRHIAISQAMQRPRFDWNFVRSRKLKASEDIGNVEVPVCLIHAVGDWLIGERHSQILYDCAKQPKELHLLNVLGGFHADRLFGVAGEEVLPLISHFVQRLATTAAGEEGRGGGEPPA